MMRAIIWAWGSLLSVRTADASRLPSVVRVEGSVGKEDTGKEGSQKAKVTSVIAVWLVPFFLGDAWQPRPEPPALRLLLREQTHRHGGGEVWLPAVCGHPLAQLSCPSQAPAQHGRGAGSHTHPPPPPPAGALVSRRRGPLPLSL